MGKKIDSTGKKIASEIIAEQLKTIAEEEATKLKNDAEVVAAKLENVTSGDLAEFAVAKALGLKNDAATTALLLLEKAEETASKLKETNPVVADKLKIAITTATSLKEIAEEVAIRLRERAELQKVAWQKEQTEISNRKLKAVNDELEQFAYITSHDLKAPLRGIMNLATWIQQDLEEQKNLSSDTKKHIALIQDRIRSMDNLIEAILQVSRVGRMNVEQSTIDVNKLIKEVIASIDKKNFTINVPEIPCIRTNKVTLSQVFQNLINNSIKHHTRDNGVIDITFNDNGDYYQFGIQDDGPGIDATYKNKLFVMFQTIGPKKPDSTGIGLALCKKIIELANGKIWFEPGTKGAKFLFTLPK
jgi:light-regulated signal transduction histidine kinase (bacteriophytochrome)